MKLKQWTLLAAFCSAMMGYAQNELIRISTETNDLVYKVGNNGRLYQVYIGEKLLNESDYKTLPNMGEIYLTHGLEDYFEPALEMVHNDHNPSTLLKYDSHEVTKPQAGVTQTAILLKDDKYPLEVKVVFEAFEKENVVKTHTEILHREKKPVKMGKYASSLLFFKQQSYYMTEFAGDWAKEVNMTEQQLSFGKKMIDTKLGSRANMFCSPFFILSLDGKAQENSGNVVLGTLAWTGNYRFTFEVDQTNMLRVISGINPYFSEYNLKPNELFRTPDFIYAFSSKGTGDASRNLHRWARNYQVKNGKGDRMTLLNNWEATYFDFNEEKLVKIFDEAKHLGVDMFLLDDGWFGNKHPRNSDTQGLGDWQETVEKLPNGIGKLVKECNDRGVKFGLWIEPEMVNPKSELYEKHPEWVIELPNREKYLFRNQMVLDLSNPKVQDYVYGIVDDLLTKYPGIAYFKWDCNSPITNIYSPYLKENQSHLYVEHVRGFYNVLQRIDKKYPNIPMMLCSGGGGRSDYEALKYFVEFWPSDNTDALERIFIQWGFSHFFPSKVLAAHVTSWGKQPLKFRVDVAMMCRLGFDIRTEEMNDQEQKFAIEAVKNFNRLKPVIMEGDLYRLVSPYAGEHSATLYATTDQSKAVLFAFDMHPRYAEQTYPVKLQGLDPKATYSVKEINLMGNRNADERTYTGDYLMKIGLNLFSSRALQSRIMEITKVQ